MEGARPPGGRASGQRRPRLFPERLTPGFPTALTAVNLAKRAGPATGGEAPDRVLGTRLQPGITFLLLWCSVSDTSWMQEGSRGCGVSRFQVCPASTGALQALPSRSKFQKHSSWRGTHKGIPQFKATTCFQPSLFLTQYLRSGSSCVRSREEMQKAETPHTGGGKPNSSSQPEPR